MRTGMSAQDLQIVSTATLRRPSVSEFKGVRRFAWSVRLYCMGSRSIRLLVRVALLIAVAVGHTWGEGRRPLLAGYFPQWGLYGDPQYLVKNLAEKAGM